MGSSQRKWNFSLCGGRRKMKQSVTIIKVIWFLNANPETAELNLSLHKILPQQKRRRWIHTLAHKIHKYLLGTKRQKELCQDLVLIMPYSHWDWWFSVLLYIRSETGNIVCEKNWIQYERKRDRERWSITLNRLWSLSIFISDELSSFQCTLEKAPSQNWVKSHLAGL